MLAICAFIIMVPFVKMLRKVQSSRGHFKKSFDEIVGMSGMRRDAKVIIESLIFT